MAEDELRVVSAVVIADARVIAPDDEVRAAVVLTNDGVEDRLSRPGVAHRGRQHGELRSRLRVVVLDDHFVGAQTDRRRYVVGFRLAYDRVEQQAVYGFKRAFLDVFVGAV